MRQQVADAHSNLCWLLATCADAKLRDGARAVEHGKKAVELRPENPNDWNNLGVAHYRAGQWKEAVAVLEKADQMLGGGDRHHRFFLVMAHWRLDHKEEARKYYDQAVAWMDEHASQDEELRRFRDEASELLGIQEHLKPNPD